MAPVHNIWSISVICPWDKLLRYKGTIFGLHDARSVQWPADLIGQVAFVDFNGVKESPQVPHLHVAVLTGRRQQVSEKETGSKMYHCPLISKVWVGEKGVNKWIFFWSLVKAMICHLFQTFTNIMLRNKSNLKKDEEM